MNRIVFDIETLAYPLGDFDQVQQDYLMKFAGNDEEREEAKRRMNLNPFTARIIAIGMLNPDSNQGKVLYEAPKTEPELSSDGAIEFVSCTEKEILERFWETVSHYNQLITFNGRTFDAPFVMLRSTLLGVKPIRNLVPYRYSAKEHCDLLDQLTFYGATRKFNLDFYCKSFGIKSPKADGVTGLDLAELVEQRRFMEIAEYCLRDVRATAELFEKWKSFLSFE
ncbi:MAG: ribonuclease H-like domain-containing protein [Ignavibacteria bacterium]|nr:ribonuclease H-like domain-containing protein [Ignavibacteria bacterium]